MDTNTKKRYSVTVSGVPLTLITGESAEFVNKMTDKLTGQINAITNHSFCVSKLDAAILCALDAIGECDKMFAKIKSLQAELSVLRLDAQNMRDELNKMSDLRAPSKPADTRTSEEKVRDLEKLLGEKFSDIKDND